MSFVQIPISILLGVALGLACGNQVLALAVIAILITAPFGAICIDKLYKKLLKKDNTSVLLKK